jgi:hypothetical protein
MRTRRRRTWWLLAIALGLAGGAAMPGCGDGEECLSWGENCSQSYKQDNYGTTSIGCCGEAKCLDHGSGIVTCGSSVGQ